MKNPDLRFAPRTDISMVEVFVEESLICEITPNGHGIIVNNVELSPEDLETVVIKAREIKKHGRNPPVCEFCGGTPFFPNTRPANKVFEEHLCTAPMHTNGPR